MILEREKKAQEEAEKDLDEFTLEKRALAAKMRDIRSVRSPSPDAAFEVASDNMLYNRPFKSVMSCWKKESVLGPRRRARSFARSSRRFESSPPLPRVDQVALC